MRMILTEIAAAFAAIVMLGACGKKEPPMVLPRVPMDDPTAAQRMQPPPFTGRCTAADSLGPFAGDTVALADLASPPRLVSVREPVYPPSEREQGWEGTIAVRVLVRPDGYVQRVDIGDGRDAFVVAAARAICAARYEPGKATGGPAYVWVEQPVRFTLDIDTPWATPRPESERRGRRRR